METKKLVVSSRFALAVAAVGGLMVYACTAADPSGSSTVTPATAGAAATGVRSQNAPPSLVVRTTPPASGGVISGLVPLKVMFNLCPSGDTDAGDSLNWQFWFGDGNLASASPDFDQFCRIEHTYARTGTYVATLSVTDKHLEDQSSQVGSLARATTTLRIQVGDVGPANNPPTLSCTSGSPAVRATSALVGSGSVFCTFGDPDGDSLTWTATASSANHVFSPSSGAVAPSAFGASTLVGSVTWICSGPNTTSVTVTANDGKGGFASATVPGLSGICVD